ncbi:MAG: efflux RND transporter periplasmic adaptor subunit [Methylotenera sp.]|uniref:efflux RND transporter periplasmic adaptor subunit n=1 Tax=Methylotenera sp. TaxID=2051956 RepID=UPI0027320905|nr:efflux RND transporter periplasmic adaptor subunit [Methylotenera sp.]MDP1522732.1 efflux RND transporter periplasmic adaptor subunit [Methylotenera sp.]MDP3333323.1 efflux RND transporter periplasmic adaptor subunit [Methylococcaceae bacterium]
MNKLIKKAIIAFIFFGVVTGAYYYYTKRNTIQPDQLYRLQEITQGDVAQSVSANGTLNPVTLISVGTQVSGRVRKLYVDYNDHVEKGQILLELDDALFASQIAQSQGNVRNVQASVELAKANEARMRTLYAQEYVSKQELDQSVQALKSARAQLDTARGQLLRDQINQSYSVIRSPVSGVVVDRVVDVGQTVAASFQTPTLIKIAQDLSKMQIDSSFAEADIGNIKVGQKAKFSVDAFPNRNFEGIVKQLRLNPTVTSNVVTYNVVVSVDNPEQILLPGMTAYVNIMVAKHDNVLLAPNAALRFKPKSDDSQTDKTASNRGQTSGRKKSGKEDTSSGKLYVIQNGKLTPLRVNVGISDGKFTEISSAELKVNDKVIVGENQTNDATSSSTSTMRFRMF